MLDRDGFYQINGRWERLERWREKKDADQFELLVTALRRQLLDRGVCRFCARELGLVSGTEGSVIRFHLASGARCPGSGRPAAG